MIRGRKPLPPEYLIECLAMAAAEDGADQMPRRRYQRLAAEYGLPSSSTIAKNCGSWPEACARAGLRPIEPFREGTPIHDRAGCVAALRECAAEFGRAPTGREYELWVMRQRRSGLTPPGLTAVKKYGGRWAEFVEEVLGDTR